MVVDGRTKSLSSETSLADDFDIFSSFFVGLVPDLAGRVFPGVQGVWDGGICISPLSLERLTIAA
jgi:hypothetical protein